ncbi:Bacterial SH3-like region [Polymorphum gilvum SL003B-26A1]|uniref:Bacterial SH3-like region n=2 Tax=Polymorphum TaxID=991903 RepID=F2IWQ8_POLGS|nr:Bacterial SH3-like region [Polymorphum gilvum SL003B-26A1]
MRKFVFSAWLAAGMLLSGAALAWTGQVTADVNMRTGPGTGYGVILVIPRGALVEVDSCTSWCAVWYAGRRGYVSARYVAGASGYRRPPPPPAVILPPPVYYPPPIYRGPRYYDPGYHPGYRPGYRPDHRPRPRPGPPPPPPPPPGGGGGPGPAPGPGSGKQPSTWPPAGGAAGGHWVPPPPSTKGGG